MAVIDVVKFDGTPDIFAWKYPSDQLSTWTQLIVNESQEAVLYKGGQALDVFQSGRHVLETQNIPVLRKFINLPFGGQTPFTAEVWFVNRAHSLDVKWGTATPIQLQDPKFGVVVPVRSFGQFGVRITDSKKFLVKLVGNLPALDKNALVTFFRGLYLAKVRDGISSYMVHKKIGILEINAYTDELCAYMRERIAPTMEEYGIELINFYVNDISFPDDDPGIVQLKAALAKRAEMDIVGYDYHVERSFDTMEGMAKNPGTPLTGLMGAGLGLGLGKTAGATLGKEFAGAAGSIDTGLESLTCAACKAKAPAGTKFCPQCGKSLEGANTIKCSKCGTVLDRGVKFCPECGDKYNPCPECGNDMNEHDTVCAQCGYTPPKPCPECGAPLKTSSRFCPECGAPLVKKCPGCDTEIDGSPKFCPECGQQL